MTNPADETREEQTKEGIRYRVEQEYEKYHNQFTFDKNGLSYWVDQIVDKLGNSVEQHIQSEITKSNLRLLDELVEKRINVGQGLYGDRYVVLVSDIEIVRKELGRGDNGTN